MTFGVIEVHRQRIEEMLATNTVATVHQRLRDEHGLAVGISGFRRFVVSEFPDESLRDRVTVLRPDVEAGEEALCGTPHRASYVDPANMRRGRCGALWSVAVGAGAPHSHRLSR